MFCDVPRSQRTWRNMCQHAPRQRASRAGRSAVSLPALISHTCCHVTRTLALAISFLGVFVLLGGCVAGAKPLPPPGAPTHPNSGEGRGGADDADSGSFAGDAANTPGAATDAGAAIDGGAADGGLFDASSDGAIPDGAVPDADGGPDGEVPDGAVDGSLDAARDTGAVDGASVDAMRRDGNS